VLVPLLLVPALVIGQGSAASGYADFPLSAIYLCGVVCCLECWRTQSVTSARLLGISAMLLPFTKLDGAVLLLCLWAAIAPLALRHRDAKLAAWAIGPGICAWLGWLALTAALGIPRDPDFEPLTPAVFLSHANRAGSLAFWAAEELVALRRWSLLWPLALISLARMAWRSERARTYTWAATLFLPLLLYPCIYFFSAWDPVEAHVKTSLPRLYEHVAPAAALLVGLALAEAVRPEGAPSGEESPATIASGVAPR